MLKAIKIFSGTYSCSLQLNIVLSLGWVNEHIRYRVRLEPKGDDDSGCSELDDLLESSSDEESNVEGRRKQRDLNVEKTLVLLFSLLETISTSLWASLHHHFPVLSLFSHAICHFIFFRECPKCTIIVT